jgi:hypothetical protein
MHQTALGGARLAGGAARSGDGCGGTDIAMGLAVPVARCGDHGKRASPSPLGGERNLRPVAGTPNATPIAIIMPGPDEARISLS